MSGPYYGQAVEDPSGSGRPVYVVRDGVKALADQEYFCKTFGYTPREVYRCKLACATMSCAEAVIHMQQFDPSDLPLDMGSPVPSAAAVAYGGVARSPSALAMFASPENGGGKMPAVGPNGSKRKHMPVPDPDAFDVRDVEQLAPSIDAKLVRTEKGGVSFLAALARAFPSGNVDPVTGEMAPLYSAIVAGMAAQPGLRVFAAEKLSRAIAVSTGDPRPHIYESLRVEASLDQYVLQASTDVCERENCVCGACTALVVASQQAAPMRNRAELLQNRAALAHKLQDPAATGKHYALRHRLHGVHMQSANAPSTYCSVTNHMKQVCEATQDLVLSFGALQADPAAKATVAHLGNILNAQQQVLDFLLLHTLRHGAATREYLVGRETFAYHNFVAVRPAEVSPHGGTENIARTDLTAGVARGRYPTGT